MGIDIAKELKGYYNFYYNFLPHEREITSLNPRLPPEINIKHEFIKQNNNNKNIKTTTNMNNNDIKEVRNIRDKQNTKGLFTINKILCYCFVFDVNDLNTFNEIYSLAMNIIQFENSKVDSEESKTIKIFIGNKFDEGISNYSNKNENSDSHYHSFSFLNSYFNKRNESLSDVYNKLISLFKLKHEDDLDNLFLSSAKFNFNIENIFNNALKKINQRDRLWKNIDFDESLEYNSDDEVVSSKERKPTLYNKIFCCFPDKSLKNKNILENKGKKEIIKGVGNENSIEDNDSKYDRNEIIVDKNERSRSIILRDNSMYENNNKFNKHLNEERNISESNSKKSCIIF